MTLTLDKLRALKRQAGAGDTPAPGAPPSAPHSRERPPAHAATPPVAPWDAVLREDASVRDTRARGEGPTRSASSADAAPATQGTRVEAARVSSRAADARGHRSGVEGLRRLLGLRDCAPMPRARARTVDRALPGTEIDDGLWLIESRIAHAPPRLPLPLAFARREGHVEAGQLLFFDTETTGLAGGTGTRAFMIGAADWHEDALRIRQLLIASMAAEAAMLRTFASWLSPSTVLSSYNGRSFDAPLLRTRYRLARLPDALHGLDHLDLLHPARRRWRGRWENCRLATIEREALRILRKDDLPGAQAPAAWLSYLRGGDAIDLRRVAEHNRQDVATLAHLLLTLSAEPPESP